MTWKNVFYLMKILLVHFKNVRERLNVDGKKKKKGGTFSHLLDHIGRKSLLYNDTLHDLTKVRLITVTQYTHFSPCLGCPVFRDVFIDKTHSERCYSLGFQPTDIESGRHFDRRVSQ